MKLPLVLVFVATTGAGVVAGLASSCSPDTPECQAVCIPIEPPLNDAGVAVVDAVPIESCPSCADPGPGCPTGCEEIPIA